MVIKRGVSEAPTRDILQAVGEIYQLVKDIVVYVKDKKQLIVGFLLVHSYSL